MYDENPVPQPEGNTVLEKNQFKSFIGSKIIKARPMSHFAFLMLKGKEVSNHENAEGYLVEYQDNYQSWSPKNVFDNALSLIHI